MRLIIPFVPVVVVIRLERRPRTPFRWRIGLKSLLAVVLIAGLGLGWVARNVHRVEAELAVIAQLRRAGVQVVEMKPSPWVLIAQVLRHPSSLKQLFNRRNPLPGGTATAISLPRLTDEKAADVVGLLGGLPHLEWMSVPEGGLSPKAIEAIRSGLPGVEVILIPRLSGSPAVLIPK
jgi:hypothetical protein